MNFVADEGVSGALVEALRANGHDMCFILLNHHVERLMMRFWNVLMTKIEY